MKYIIAIIQPHRLDAVREALTQFGISGLTVSEVKGYGRQGGHTEIYRGAEYKISFVPKLKLEIAVSADTSDKAVEAIRNAAGTGKIGDGKIFVLDLLEAVRVRTGESGTDAL
ncbi:P-II family nitrogen regulator [Tepidamorphus sp. 3E244]|uniref:P-II family nitrogen regulator n=1 Tax=Tepidamorphus sp. 3E244 TaxID=3385498 RepID=UPI0038FC0ECB